MLLTLSGILTPLVAGSPRCGRGSRLTGSLRGVRRRRRRLLLLPRRLNCWVGAVRRSSGHIFLRIAPHADYHCHISATKSAIKRNVRWCMWTVPMRKRERDLAKKDDSGKSNLSERSHRLRRASIGAINTFKIAIGDRKRHPIRMCKYREASSKVNCTQPFRN